MFFLDIFLVYKPSRQSLCELGSPSYQRKLSSNNQLKSSLMQAHMLWSTKDCLNVILFRLCEILHTTPSKDQC